VGVGSRFEKTRTSRLEALGSGRVVSNFSGVVCNFSSRFILHEYYFCDQLSCTFCLNMLIDPDVDGLKRLRLTSKIIPLISRRVTFFPKAAARQLFDGDCDAADLTRQESLVGAKVIYSANEGNSTACGNSSVY